MATHIPKQADIKSREELQELANNSQTTLTLSNGRKIKIGSIYFDAQNKIDDIIVEHDNTAQLVKEGKLSEQEGNIETRKYFAKITAAVLLNGYFSIRLWWWIKWRIIYRHWNLSGEDYLIIISEAKKKGHQQEYYLAMALAMTMNDTCTTMTKKEAEVFLHELNSARSLQP